MFYLLLYRPTENPIIKKTLGWMILLAAVAVLIMIYFYNTLMGKEEYLRKFFEGSVKVGKPYYSDSKNSYVSICNESDVPFTLKKSSEKNGYPETISIPSGRTVIVNISKDVSGGAEYEVTNMIITPEKNLCVNLF